MANGRAGDPDHALELLWRARERESRPGLSLDGIVRAAVELADAEGLAGLSMRKVADRLGFTTMSLYRHVPGRDQLVDLMVDAVLGEHPDDIADEEGWRARLETAARQAWRIRGRHPWLAEVRGTRHLPGPNAVAHYDYMLSTLTGTALTPAEMLAVVGMVGRFVDAEALRLLEIRHEERRSGMSEADWWGARDTLYDRLDRYPTISALWEAGGWDAPEDPFEFGLRRLLDGVQVLIGQRDESSDESCEVCGGPLESTTSGRPRVYCSHACRQRAYRRRRPD
ncbi:TetR/AcrR family transcriptional regulator C-terminal domain-containing protein [Microtetraspora sp. AC03309]|uniref:TetR/AcrR family transcriptional regulator n=1 Tax=Microtetraspora sp. AC03309 TaxID=2779376 RepID=UPI001E37815F|nr:TetR/AcrR family transcriptional regulator [Microtetraspora sp. AC03309]MCC5575862.1 TetR/AcrR family transcriptional regulator C-terminal domain-containing protein [Microtetraspora sp. AC03309]